MKRTPWWKDPDVLMIIGLTLGGLAYMAVYSHLADALVLGH